MKKYRIKECLSIHRRLAYKIQRLVLFVWWNIDWGFCYDAPEDAIEYIENLNKNKVVKYVEL